MVKINKKNLDEMLGDNFKVTQREKGFYEILTPFLDKRNDFIVIYMKTFDHSTIISDYGETLGDIEYYDLDDMVAKLIKRTSIYKLSDTKNIFINIKNNVSEEEFLFTLFQLIELILKINGLATFVDIYAYDAIKDSGLQIEE